MIHARQADYYQALGESNAAGNSTKFIAFMLEALRSAIAEAVADEI